MRSKFFLMTATVLITLSCCVMCYNNPDIKNTRWTCVVEEFVADAGTETTTFTLSFVSNKDFVMEYRSVLPAHPAMYMNPDGTVDRIPESSREFSYKGTYSLRQGVITLTSEDGDVYTLDYKPEKLETDNLYFRPIVFIQEPQKP